MQSPDELFDVCDINDRVIGQARRADVHAQNLLHRAVHIWVFRTDGRLVVQRRSASKDQYPNGLTSSASGHLDSGEDYLDAAIRELGEELGLCDVELLYAVKLAASPETAYEHTVLYVTMTDAVLTPAVGEVAGLEVKSLSELTELLSSPDGGNLTPPFRELLKWWLAKPHDDGFRAITYFNKG
jgi:isopentenyl-diphosphate Delta-isomerase